MVSNLSDEETLLRYRWELARRDPVEFLRYFVFTFDQHDLDMPIKPMPVEERPHLAAIARVWHKMWAGNLWLRNPATGKVQRCRGIAEEKSRQVMQSWEYIALCVWDVIFHQGRLVFMQSKREEDAIGNEAGGTGLLGRAKFILSHLPGKQVLVPRMVSRANKLEFTEMNSVLWAIPEGGDIIRSHTASGVFSDECAFQPEFESAFTAAMPSLRGGGWFAGVSTPDPGFFRDLCEDRKAEAQAA